MGRVFHKKIPVLLVVITLIAGTILCACGNSSKETIRSAEVPMYFYSIDQQDSINLYFTDDSLDIPYLDIDTVEELIERVYHEINEDNGYSLDVEKSGSLVTFTRDNQYYMEIDFDKDTFSFKDFDAFFVPSWSKTIMDVLSPDGVFDGFIISEDSSYSRYGSEVVIDLKKYGIDLVADGGNYYIPLQTVSDIMLALPCYVLLLYNERSVFVYEYGSETGKDLLRKWYEAEPVQEKSEALSEFSYNELCMVMDYYYGLKEYHGIDSFDKFFSDVALKDALKSQDSAVGANALSVFLDLYIDDSHSGYTLNSWRLGMDAEVESKYGHSALSMYESSMKYYQARMEYFPEEVPGYQEVGNTAYITFDSFMTKDKDVDYYKEPPTADTEDTIGLFLYAYSQITRENSPIENVVFDVSLNGGGDTVTASYIISLILGEGTLCIHDTLTGAYANESFRADANLDGQFDEKDSLLDYNLYCLTSPSSFSCGNLMPSVLKSSSMVRIIGEQSGGGACVVMPLSTADGTILQISGPNRLSYMKNGSIYDIDKGIEPDYIIDKPEHFYDRAKLTDYINSLY